MFFGWVRVAFVLQHLQRCNQLGTRVARLDHFVDVAASGGDVGVGELFGVFGDQFFTALRGIVRPLDFILERGY